MISRSGIHAVRALACLAAGPPRRFVGAAAVAGKVGAPANYLGKLLNQLAREGLLESRKGAGGGFRLARPAERISLLEVLGPIEQLDRWDGCILGGNRCSDDEPCSMHARWTRLRAAYLELLSDTTLAGVGDRELPVAPTRKGAIR